MVLEDENVVRELKEETLDPEDWDELRALGRGTAC